MIVPGFYERFLLYMVLTAEGGYLVVARRRHVILAADGYDAVYEAGELGGAAGCYVALHRGGEAGGEAVHHAQAAGDEIFREGESHGLADGLHLLYQSLKERARLAGDLEGIRLDAKIQSGRAHR